MPALKAAVLKEKKVENVKKREWKFKIWVITFFC